MWSNKTCRRCEMEIEDRWKECTVALREDKGIGQGRGETLSEPLCNACRYEFEDWVYGDEGSPRKVVELTLTVTGSQ